MNTAKLAKVVALTGIVVAVVGVVAGLSLSAALAGNPGGERERAGPASTFTPEQQHTQRLEEIRAESAKVFAIAIAVVISLSCLAAGYAVGKVGAAAMGAASERPEIVGRALLFVALAEGIAIYGVLAAILLYTKITQ